MGLLFHEVPPFCVQPPCINRRCRGVIGDEQGRGVGQGGVKMIDEPLTRSIAAISGLIWLAGILGPLDLNIRARRCRRLGKRMVMKLCRVKSSGCILDYDKTLITELRMQSNIYSFTFEDSWDKRGDFGSPHKMYSIFERVKRTECTSELHGTAQSIY